MPGVYPGGRGMLKLRFDRYITTIKGALATSNSSFTPYSPKLPLFKERRDELSLYSTFSPHSPFAKGFAMSFEFLLRLWRVFAIFDIFAVFAKYTIFVKIAPHAFAIFAIAGWFSLLSSY